MNVLVLGCGAKDHAIAWWFSKSKLIEGLYIAPGNPGTGDFAINADIDPSDKEAVLKLCKSYNIDFVFIGTEAPLVTGVVDYLNANKIATFGAPSYALPIEANRKFSREFASRHGVPMPHYETFENTKDLSSYLKKHEGITYTIKPNDLSPSRIMTISDNYDALMIYAEKLLEKGPILLEEYMEGLSATASILMDEDSYVVLPICSEYTKREHTDKHVGVATGGMGAVCPLALSQEIIQMVRNSIVIPTVEGLKKEKLSYKGVLTMSVIINDKGSYLVDYHVRLNDPATQAIVPLVKNDLVEIMQAILDNNLKNITIETTNESTVSVVVASDGYPLSPVTGVPVSPIPAVKLRNAIESSKALVFFGAMEQNKEKTFYYTTGGRVATVVGIGNNIIEANEKAYEAIDVVSFDGAWYRKDIGNKFFESTTRK